MGAPTEASRKSEAICQPTRQEHRFSAPVPGLRAFEAASLALPGALRAGLCPRLASFLALRSWKFRGELPVGNGNPCFSSSGTGREDPQPDTNPSQLWFAVKRAFYAEPRGEAESKKAPLEGGFGG